MLVMPHLIALPRQRHYRIIPSVYPAINFFEDLVDPEEMETLWEIESMTNDRLRQETGDIFLVAPEDRISGHGSSVVMAAFTHVGRPSRFSDGSFGVYYASFTQETAIHETVFHREKFLSATGEDPCELTMRMYEGQILQPLHDIRAPAYNEFHHVDNYMASQALGKKLKEEQSWGIVYNSVRDDEGQCIAALRPKAISVPKSVMHLKYIWNGQAIVDVVKTTSLFKP